MGHEVWSLGELNTMHIKKRSILYLLAFGLLVSAVFGCTVPVEVPSLPIHNDGGAPRMALDASPSIDSEVDAVTIDQSGLFDAEPVSGVILDAMPGPQQDMGMRLSDASLDAVATPTDMMTDRIPTFDDGWRQRVRIRINSENIAETVTNVPVFVRVPWTVVNPDALDDDGHDIRFVDRDGAILPHYVNFFNDEEMHVWVRLAVVDPTLENSIWFYFDNPAAEALPQDFWAEDGVSILHMYSQGTILARSFVDGSGNENTGVVFQRGFAGESNIGTYGYNYRLRGGSGSVVIPSLTNTNFAPEGYTVSVSYRRPRNGGPASYFFGDPDNTGAQYTMRYTGRSECEILCWIDGRESGAPVTLPCEEDEDTKQIHISFAFSPGAAWVVLNENIHDIYNIDPIPDSSAGFRPSGQSFTFGTNLDVVVDEIHVQRGAKTHDWMRVRQRSLLGTLLSFDEAETLDPSVAERE